MKEALFMFLKCAVVTAVLSGGLWGSSLSLPDAYLYVAVDGTLGGGPGMYSVPGAVATANLVPAVQLTANAYGSGDAVGLASEHDANIEVEYYVGVNGGSDGDIVPLVVTASLSAHAEAAAATQQEILDGTEPGAEAAATLEIGATDITVGCIVGYQIPCGENYWNSNYGLSWSGTIPVSYQIGSGGISIDIHSYAWVDGSGTAYAYADPLIQIDPNFANASDYTLSISSDVGNALGSPAPEPGSLALIGLIAGPILLKRFTGLRRRF